MIMACHRDGRLSCHLKSSCLPPLLTEAGDTDGRLADAVARGNAKHVKTQNTESKSRWGHSVRPSAGACPGSLPGISIARETITIQSSKHGFY